MTQTLLEMWTMADFGLLKPFAAVAMLAACAWADIDNPTRPAIGTWTWDAASTLPDDGVSVACPVELQAANTDTGVTGGGYRQLSNVGIIFGSVTLTCDDPTLTCTDAVLHGHQQWVAAGGAPNQPLFDHANGRVRLPDPAKVWSVSYKMAVGPGRWIRQWQHDEPITPSQCSGSVQWAATIAGNLGRRLHCENETISHIVEFPDGKYSGRLQLDAQALIERLRIDQGYYDSVNGWPTRLDRLLLNGMPCITCASGAKNIEFTDFEVYADRLPDAYWQEVLTNSAKWNYAAVANTFQNSPYGSGIAFTPQSNRVVDGLKATVGQLQVHDMPGSCILSANKFVDWAADTLRIGSSYHGRPYYELNGRITNLELEGHSRTSMGRIAAGTSIQNLRYKSLDLTNPVSPGENQTAAFGASDSRGEGEIYLPNLSIDLRGSQYETGLMLGVPGVFRGVIRGGGITFNANASGAIKTDVDLEMDGPAPIWSFPTKNGQANWSSLTAKLLMRGTATGVEAPSTIRVKRNSTHPAGHTQNVRLRYINARVNSDGSPSQTLGIIWLPDLATTAPSDCVPTVIHIEGGRWNNTTPLLFSITTGYTQSTPPSAWPADIADYPVRIIVRDAELNVVKPPTPGDNTYPQQFAILELVNCRDLSGRLIDAEKIKDGSWWAP